jgi:hypothetical protein
MASVLDSTELIDSEDQTAFNRAVWEKVLADAHAHVEGFASPAIAVMCARFGWLKASASPVSLPRPYGVPR